MYTQTHVGLLCCVGSDSNVAVPLDKWHTPGGGGSNPPPEIPKAPQKRAKPNPLVKTVKSCWI